MTNLINLKFYNLRVDMVFKKVFHLNIYIVYSRNRQNICLIIVTFFTKKKTIEMYQSKIQFYEIQINILNECTKILCMYLCGQ